MPPVKTPPWAPQSLLPLSTGSLTLGVKRGARPGFSTKSKNSLTAAATRITGTPDRINRGNKTSSAARAWQEEVLIAATQIGELRYIANTTANAASRAWVFPADAKKNPDDTAKSRPTYATADNAPEEEGAPPGAIDPEIIRRTALLLILIGEAYLVELPRKVGRPADGAPERETHVIAPMDVHFEGDDFVRIGGTEKGGRVTGGLRYPLNGAGKAVVTRIHRPDARHADEPDSPARSAIPVLRELMGLSMHVSATIDSRASAGIVGYPSDAEISRPIGQPEAPSFADAFNEALIEPIHDRDHASAVAPVLIGIPPGVDGSIKDKIVWLMSPGSMLDQNVHQLRDDNIRRIALGMDAPPEVILGAKGLSHFGSWSVEGEFIRLQIAPLLKLIADALTIAYDIVYTFDTNPLTVRPNRAVEAQALHDRDAVGDATLRAATGFTEEDAEFAIPTDPAVRLAMKRVIKSPSLLVSPGLPAVVDQYRIILGQDPMFQEYYPGKPAAPLPPVASKGEPSGRSGENPESNRPVSDGSPEGGADGKPHAVPGTD